jgi:hypothetical protein
MAAIADRIYMAKPKTYNEDDREATQEKAREARGFCQARTVDTGGR